MKASMYIKKLESVEELKEGAMDGLAQVKESDFKVRLGR